MQFLENTLGRAVWCRSWIREPYPASLLKLIDFLFYCDVLTPEFSQKFWGALVGLDLVQPYSHVPLLIYKNAEGAILERDPQLEGVVTRVTRTPSIHMVYLENGLQTAQSVFEQLVKLYTDKAELLQKEQQKLVTDAINASSHENKNAEYDHAAQNSMRTQEVQDTATSEDQNQTIEQIEKNEISHPLYTIPDALMIGIIQVMLDEIDLYG